MKAIKAKKAPRELKSHKINLCITDTEYKLLDTIRNNHNKSISQLVRDAISFYGIYYQTPIQTPTE